MNLFRSGLIFSLIALPLAAQTGTEKGEWRYYGGDDYNSRYSALDQINEQNIGQVAVAWRWKSTNFGATPQASSETTPLMVNGVLYFTAGTRRTVVAVDADERILRVNRAAGALFGVDPARVEHEVAAPLQGLDRGQDHRDHNRTTRRSRAVTLLQDGLVPLAPGRCDRDRGDDAPAAAGRAGRSAGANRPARPMRAGDANSATMACICAVTVALLSPGTI